jgi:uncharacterized protein YaeQ
MALSSSVHKVNIYISNMDTNFYQEFDFTMAMHPSENQTRMMYRLIAFAHSAHEDLTFTKGLGDIEEPELWQRSLTGEILHWIELGLPDEKRIKQAAGKSRKVSIYTYHKNKALEWMPKILTKFCDNDKVNIYNLEKIDDEELDSLVEKSMSLTCTIEDNTLYIGNDNKRIGISLIKQT